MLLDIAPDLHFKHFTVAEAKLPSEALRALPDVALETVAICADIEHHVFNAEHTDPQVADALRRTHWFDLREWAQRAPGGGPVG